jgi:hypothetical protein
VTSERRKFLKVRSLLNYLWSWAFWRSVYYLCSRHDFTYIRGWMQMVLAPNDLFSWNKNTVRHGIFDRGIHYVHYVTYYTMHATLTLCINISWSCVGAVFLVLGHLAMYPLLHCPKSTNAHCPFLGVRGPLPQKWRPLSQDPRTLPPHGSEQFIPSHLPLTKYLKYFLIEFHSTSKRIVKKCHCK